MLDAGAIGNKYEVQERIGSGAMAVVYKVVHKQLNATYALKVVDAGRMAERLLREGRVQAGLRHPNVVTVHDVLEVEGKPALLMDYVEGPTLKGYLIGHHPLELDEIDRIAQGILKGVRAVHQAGHLHRDLKPGNILLETQDGVRVPRIADFGLAKVFNDPNDPIQTKSGQLLGSPAYMSPEQTKSATDLDERTDIWALGAVLYQLLTGHLAFPHRDIVTIFSMIRSGSFEDPRALRDGVPKRMWNAVFAALTVEHAERAPTCDALLELWTGEREVQIPRLTRAHDVPDPMQATIDLTTLPPAASQWRTNVLVLALLLASAAMVLPLLPGMPWSPTVSVDPSASPPHPAPKPVTPEALEPLAPVRPVTPAPIAATPVSRPRPSPEPRTPRPVPPPQTVAAGQPTQIVPAPIAPAPIAPAPIAPAQIVPGTFQSTGDAERVWLVRAGTHHDPGAVEPGVYTVTARFPGRPAAPIEGLTVEVRSGTLTTIDCRGGFFTCRSR